MKKINLRDIIMFFFLLMVIPHISACNDESEYEVIANDEIVLYEQDDSSTITNDYSSEGSRISENQYDEPMEYLQSISDELSKGDFKVVDAPISGSGQIYGEYIYGNFWSGDDEEMSSVISRISLVNPNDYYEFDTKKIVDTKGIFSLDENNIEYYVGYNEIIEKWIINTENNECDKVGEGVAENITTSQSNIVGIYKENEFYYFHYVLWGDKYSNDGRTIYEYRVYVKDKDLNTVYYEDINICESLTNKLLFDEENRLCFLGYDESGYFIQQIKRNETDNFQRTNIGGEWNPQGMWQTYIYNHEIWYISNGYVNKTDIDTGLTEKIFYLSSAGIEAEDFIYDWRIVSGIVEIIYPNKVIYIKVD